MQKAMGRREKEEQSSCEQNSSANENLENNTTTASTRIPRMLYHNRKLQPSKDLGQRQRSKEKKIRKEKRKQGKDKEYSGHQEKGPRKETQFTQSRGRGTLARQTTAQAIHRSICHRQEYALNRNLNGSHSIDRRYKSTGDPGEPKGERETMCASVQTLNVPKKRSRTYYSFDTPGYGMLPSTLFCGGCRDKHSVWRNARKWVLKCMTKTGASIFRLPARKDSTFSSTSTPTETAHTANLFLLYRTPTNPSHFPTTILFFILYLGAPPFNTTSFLPEGNA
ncbi:hypothetical protein BDY21DRAFT_345741 [Lineolata rhizophorae]|uniref:Uncharacterized protein n=1 Tax=Lineolata rhizophorae TaxID=578093 RepID=A0A6A6NY70_9PEZI|nr:hypothetical protein BDY21DRAFT_345741 [Lineolata rhizophorae]